MNFTLFFLLQGSVVERLSGCGPTLPLGLETSAPTVQDLWFPFCGLVCFVPSEPGMSPPSLPSTVSAINTLGRI